MFRWSSGWTMFLGSVVGLGLLVLMLVGLSGHGEAGSPLILYCAAGVRLPVEATAREYERKHGVSVILQYGPSNTLLAQADMTKTGDLFLPGDDSYIELAREKNLIVEKAPLARMMAALAVAKGNPKRIRLLDDLLRPDVRLAQPMPDAAAAGRLVRDALLKSGHWDRINKHTAVFKPTVNDVANDIKVETVDAGFIWDALATQYPELELVPITQLADSHALISIGILKSSSQLAAARHFMHYLVAKDTGLRVFEQHGFKPVDP